MAKRGPKPKAEAAKVVEGVRKDRRKPATAPAPSRPAVPEYLTGPAQLVWARLCDELEALGTLSTADGLAISLYCDAFERWALAKQDLDRYGTVVESQSGAIKSNPAAGMAATAWNQMARILSELGLTPASRGQTGNAKVAEKPDALTEFLARQS